MKRTKILLPHPPNEEFGRISFFTVSESLLSLLQSRIRMKEDKTR